jgi:hypothetical protein
MGDLAKLLLVVGSNAPDDPIQRLRTNLSGPDPYTTRWDPTRDTTGTTPYRWVGLRQRVLFAQRLLEIRTLTATPSGN